MENKGLIPQNIFLGTVFFFCLNLCTCDVEVGACIHAPRFNMLGMLALTKHWRRHRQTDPWVKAHKIRKRAHAHHGICVGIRGQLQVSSLTLHIGPGSPAPCWEWQASLSGSFWGLSSAYLYSCHLTVEVLQLQTRSTTELYVDVEDKTQVHTLLQQAMQPLSISLNPEHFLLHATYNCYVKQVVSRTVIERKGW